MTLDHLPTIHCTRRTILFPSGDSPRRTLQATKKPIRSGVDCFQLLNGNPATDGGIRSHALTEFDRAKLRFWNGQFERGLICLVHLMAWAGARSFDHIPPLGKLQYALTEMIRYLELNADSMPNYGERYHGGQRISTGFVESAVNEIIAKRMVKKQKMRWNRHTVQSFLDVRIHVLNGTLEGAFRHWHKAFRPIAYTSQLAASA